VDIVAKKDGKRIAVEIETGKSDAVYNIRKDLEAGFDEVIIMATNSKVKEQVIYKLKELRLDNKKKVKVTDSLDNLMNS